MRIDRVLAVVRREYLAGVRTRGFWLSTLLLPLFMGALLFLPSLLMMKSRSTLDLVVVDATGSGIGERLATELEADAKVSRPSAGPMVSDERAESSRFAVDVRAAGDDPAAQRAALDREVLAGTIGAWIWIDAETLAGASVPYHAASVSNFVTQRILARRLTDVVGASRLSAAGIDPAQVESLTADVDLETVRVSAEGTRREDGGTGFMLAMLLFFMLYMVTLIYGQQVMNGVLEEKTSRIVEVVLATTRPIELLAGKLLGIAAVGLTQLGIWMGTALVLTAPGALAAASSLPAGLTIPTVTPALALHFLGHFLLGFLLFASLYAAVGAASNDVKEAQQLASSVVLFVVAPVVVMFTIINDPDSTLATALSLFPPFTPLLMMLRIAVKTPPLWQIAAGYLLTALFVAGLVWACARIYRVGLLMHGKRPTLAELWRWVRHA